MLTDVDQHDNPENTVLAALGSLPAMRQKIFYALDLDDFLTPANKQLFETARNLHMSGQEYPMSLTKELLQYGSPASWKNAIYGVKEQKLTNSLRQFISMTETVLQDPNISASDGMNMLSDFVRNVNETQKTIHIQTMPEVMERVSKVIESGDAEKYVPWGFACLNAARLEPGTLAIIGARPSVGKTAFCVSAMMNMAMHGIKVGLICIEMDNFQIAIRMLSQSCGARYSDILRKSLPSKASADRFQESFSYLSKTKNLHLHCGFHLSVAEIEGVCNQWVNQKGVQIVFIDYIQRIKHIRAESERLRVGKTSYAMKLIARRLQIPVVVCSQLRRDIESKRPHLKDLKESGDLEQDADIVILIDKDGKYRRSIDGVEVEADMEYCRAFHIAKNRNGRCGICFIDFDGATMKFEA